MASIVVIDYNGQGGTGTPPRQVFEINSESNLSIDLGSFTVENAWIDTATTYGLIDVPQEYIQYTSYEPGVLIIDHVMEQHARVSNQVPQKYYTVVFNAMGGSVEPASKDIYCTFVSWNTQSDGSGVTYHPGDEVAFEITSTISVESGAMFIEDSWPQSNVSTGQFSIPSEFSEDIEFLPGVLKVLKDVQDTSLYLYAIWEDPVAGTLPTPSWNGHNFQRWSIDQSDSDTLDSTTVLHSDITVYAVWSTVILFDSDGGFIYDPDTSTWSSTVSKEKIPGVVFVIPDYQVSKSMSSSQTITNVGDSSESVRFLGWSTSRGASSPEYVAGDIYSSEEPLTLYAVYQIFTYTVQFVDGYSVPERILKQYNNVPKGTGVTPPANPVRTGYTFSGWIGDYNYIESDTKIIASWGFTPIWIYRRNAWIKYEPKEH